MSDLYAKRDAEALGEHYISHVSAMTTEALHSKSDIAAELAWRDAYIERLENHDKVLDKGDGWEAYELARWALVQIVDDGYDGRSMFPLISRIERRLAMYESQLAKAEANT